MADKPITKEEKYLAYLAGEYNRDIPTPITRKEKYLYKICKEGTGVSGEAIEKAVASYLSEKGVGFAVDADGYVSIKSQEE